MICEKMITYGMINLAICESSTRRLHSLSLLDEASTRIRDGIVVAPKKLVGARVTYHTSHIVALIAG